MRRAGVVVLSLAACTTDNPEFGLDGGSSGSDASVESSSGNVSLTDTSADESSTGDANRCLMPDDRNPHVRMLGDSLGAGTTTGSIAVVNGNLHVDCASECAAALGGECVPFGFEIVPPLWEGWVPPDGCFRFQWLGNLETIQELRVGAVDDRDQLVVLGPDPIFAQTYDIEAKLLDGCTCDGQACCPPDAGTYGLELHADADVFVDPEHWFEEDVLWAEAIYRVENGGSAIVPHCETPNRLQFRAFRTE